jgi:hypothetical protein
MQYEMEDSIEESQNCTVEESVKNRERCGRFVSLGFTSGIGGSAGCRVDDLTDERR